MLKRADSTLRRATTRVAPTMDENGWGAVVKQARLFVWSFAVIFVCMSMLLVGCGSQQQGQKQQQPDPRLKLFHVLSSRIVILDTQAEVDGMVQNMGKERFPFDVTLVATFYDRAGKVVGQAQGAAEDVFPGMMRPFVLIGQVDSSTYSRMVVTPVNLHERRYEKSLPSPPPVTP
ncbi:MAG: hypothetical protein NVSMB27_24990 [Ktedonobacteraceae bacterium]